MAESVHPGEILREELKARGVTQSACAVMVGRSVQVVNLIINGKRNITPDTALDLEHGLGVSAGFWVRLQADHDLCVARQRRDIPSGDDQVAPRLAGSTLDDQAIHGWFGLTYSSYLVLHRTLLQSMPGEWQRELVHLLEQLRAAFWNVEQPDCYDVIPGTEAIVNELTDEQRKRLGITSSVDDMTEEQYEEFLDAEDGEAFYADKDGNSLDAHSYVVVPGAEEIPPYNRGRTRLAPDFEAYTRTRLRLEEDQ